MAPRESHREPFASHAYDEGLFDRRLDYQAIAGLGSSIPSEGAFLVPNEFGLELWQRTLDTGRILDRCSGMPVTVGDELKIPAIDETSRADGSRFGGTRMHWVEEGETSTPTKPKFGELALRPKKLLGLAYSTEELLADAPALGVWLERVFALEAGFVIEDAIVNGTGTGRPLGVLHSDTLVTVAAEGGQAAATVLPANLVNMAARLWGPSHRNAIWLMPNEAFEQIADASFSNGAPVVTYGPDGRRLILGMPLELNEYTPALGSAGDVLLGDFSQYLIGEKEPEFIGSIHVRFIYEEGVFRIRYRVDGQPAWQSPVTPKNGTATQSPFVQVCASVLVQIPGP